MHAPFNSSHLTIRISIHYRHRTHNHIGPASTNNNNNNNATGSPTMSTAAVASRSTHTADKSPSWHTPPKKSSSTSSIHSCYDDDELNWPTSGKLVKKSSLKFSFLSQHNFADDCKPKLVRRASFYVDKELSNHAYYTDFNNPAVLDQIAKGKMTKE